MNPSEGAPGRDADASAERQELIDKYKESLTRLHHFSDSVRELGSAGGDVIGGNRGLVLDMCVTIETILDHDLTRVEKPEQSEVNIEGGSYNPDDLALSTVESVADRLRQRVDALKRPHASGGN